MKDAENPGVSTTARFVIAYMAMIENATALLYAAGYQTRGKGHHETPFNALGEFLGADGPEWVIYLQKCRNTRNTTTYEKWVEIPEAQLAEFISRTYELAKRTRAWIAKNRPKLLPPPPAASPSSSTPAP